MLLTFIWVCSLAVASANVAKKYAVPTPAGGRTDVHGWLILPIDQPLPTDNTTAEAIDAWYSHHVPEFFTDSPHNFQIIIRGSLVPTSSIEGELYPIDIPHPPADELVTYEYSFTPPSPFSLNNLLNGDIKKMNGMYYNGSFDTPYERIPQSLATLVVKELTTAVYLDEHETQSYPNLRYLSYPRSTVPAASGHFYFAHEIHAQPDFDHIVHGTVADCVSPAAIPNEVLVNVVSRPGASWEIVGTENVLENKLVAGQVNDHLVFVYRLMWYSAKALHSTYNISYIVALFVIFIYSVQRFRLWQRRVTRSCR